jgi:putative membrane-bound dehydrogenase-like protein
MKQNRAHRHPTALAGILLSTVALWSSDPPPADIVPFAGLSAEEACRHATLPPGFQMHVFAAEPEVVQPIAFCLDHRGRVWVAEGRTYPVRRGHPPRDETPSADGTASPAQLKDLFAGADRILVFEDTNGDHRADRRTVFLENLNLVSGLEVGFGGVWIGAAPYLLFVPVTDWEHPRPAGDPRILLDGWNYSADTHETLNTFTWGPDGWLYGCHGVFCPSNVGKPGTPEPDRQWCDAAAWRYHPTRHQFEIFTEGGSNPWGIDFDEYGQLWAEMCVIPHLFHMIQGARIQRQGGEHYAIQPDERRRFVPARAKPVHPHIYDDLKTHGDHVHWTGNLGPHAANARSDAVGGGHAHAGLMVYLGDSWPGEYRGHLFIGNIHGQRINTDVVERRGSGFIGRHGPDFLNFNDSWSQTLNQLYDHDGSVYIIDWYDKNQCHHTRDDGHDRSNGRIYKVIYDHQPVTRVDLAQRSDAALIRELYHHNDWFPRQAQRLLQHRAHQGSLSPSAQQQLTRLTTGGPTTALPPHYRHAHHSTTQLRLLWARHVTVGLDDTVIARNLASPDEWVRAWTIQLALESRLSPSTSNGHPDSQTLNLASTLAELARSDPSPLVRLYLASGAQRIDNLHTRARILQRLLQHAEDATDHNLPLLIWFALEPLVAHNPDPWLDTTLGTPLPRILEFTTRRLASGDIPNGLGIIARRLQSPHTQPRQLEMLRGLSAALRGQRTAPMPDTWPAAESHLAANPHPEIRTLAQSLSLKFGSDRARTELRHTALDAQSPTPIRRAALDALLAAKDSALPHVLRELLHAAELRGPALRALAQFADPQTPETVLRVYASLDSSQRRDALNTLASRPPYARSLLDAVAARQIPVNDITADVIRQLRSFNDPDVQEQLALLYGPARPVDPDRQAEIERYRRIYHAGGSQPGDASRGRVVYNLVCAQCHTLFDDGGAVGPDLTGSNRGDLNYILENILDPNAVIPNEYRATEIETTDGRVVTGIVKVQGDTHLTLQTANELLNIPRDEILALDHSELSMMPEGLLDPLSDQQVRDLIYYLSRPGQVPLPPDQP